MESTSRAGSHTTTLAATRADLELRQQAEELENKLLAELAAAELYHQTTAAAAQEPAPRSRTLPPSRKPPAAAKPARPSAPPAGTARGHVGAPTVASRAWPPPRTAPAPAPAPLAITAVNRTPLRSQPRPPQPQPPQPQSPQPLPPQPRLRPVPPVPKLAGVPAGARRQLVEWMQSQRQALQEERTALSWLLQAVQGCAREARGGFEQVVGRLAQAEAQQLALAGRGQCL